MLERLKLGYRMLRCMNLNNALNPSRYEKRLEKFGDSIGNLLDSWWDD